MVEMDPPETQREMVPTLASELAAVGFADAAVIGRGGFGVVYRCTEADLDRTVAVKVLTEDLDADNLVRFLREQRAMSLLTGHPNIVVVLRAGTTESGRPYLVMPYHERGSLHDRIRRDGPLSVAEALTLGVKTAGAIESAHRLSILHLDVKPANILLTDYGEPALTDFGIAKVGGEFLTASGQVAGSPAFTDPGVLAGAAPSPAADVYGLGATLFCALTAHAAFERRSGEHVVAHFARIADRPVPNLGEEGIDGDIAALVAGAMSRDPGERPTAAELGEALRAAQHRRAHRVDEMALRRDSPPGRADVPAPSAEDRSLSSRRSRASSSGPVAQLPVELTSFVGRRSELMQTRQLLAKHRLVTLTGIGGAGKTRVAVRAAAGASRDFPDGAWMVDLADLHEGPLLPGMIADALAVPTRGGGPLLDQLIEYLSSRSLLLVLDNCEQIVDAAAQVTQTLLRLCPAVRVLTTSREALGIGGEVVLRVPPLTVPGPQARPSVATAPSFEAITLFVDRAVAAVPDFVLTDGNVTAVARICERLDGLPLPIELAAARLRAMSPDQILRGLTDRYALLTRGNRIAPSRQQTLRGCIDWSYELCTAAEQLLWSRISVFAGSAPFEATHHVCLGEAAPTELLDLLAALVDKSVLIREESGTEVRFRMLETVRAYGRELLEQAGELVDTRRRHRDWYLQLALDAENGWITAAQRGWMTRLDREQPNLREALEFTLVDDGAGSANALTFAAALQPFWFARGRIAEGQQWLGRALADGADGAGGAEPSALRAKALYRAISMSDVLGENSSGADMAAQAQRLAERTDDRLTRARLTFCEGLHAVFGPHPRRARECLEAALADFREVGDVYEVLVTLVTVGWACELQEDFAAALDCHEQALAIAEERGESSYRSHALWACAVAVWHMGDGDGAVALLQKGLRLARANRDPLIATTCLEALAWIACAEGDARRAAVLLGAARTLSQATGSSTVLFPNLLIHHQECESAVRASLGARAFETAHREGAGLDLDSAIDCALGEQPAGPGSPSASRQSAVVELTRREREVAGLVAEGLTNKAIAGRLVISVRTAQGHVEHILTKLGFRSRAQIAAWVAARSGPPPD